MKQSSEFEANVMVYDPSLNHINNCHSLYADTTSYF